MMIQALQTVFESFKRPIGRKRYRQPLERTLTMVFMGDVEWENIERGVAAWIEEQRWRMKKIFCFRRKGPIE